MRSLTALIISIQILTSCGPSQETEQKKYFVFTRQVVPSGNYYIYHFERDGMMAFSDFIVGTKLFKKTDEFNEDWGYDLPGAIGQWISTDTLLVYAFDREKNPIDTLPTSVSFETYNDIVIKKLTYRSNSGARDFFEFDSLALDGNLFKIFNVRRKHNGQHLGTLVFPLGPITVSHDGDSISKVEISMIHKSLNLAVIDSLGNTNENKPKIGMFRYELTPTKKIHLDESDVRGIFMDGAEKSSR